MMAFTTLTACSHHPQDEVNLHEAWRLLAEENDLELVICVASALRRGILDQTEASRYEKPLGNVEAPFIISGLGQLIDGTINADRTMTFGS